MTINFEDMSFTATEHFNGGEGTFYAKIVNDGLNKILYGKLEPGSTIGMHCHDTSSEIIYILSGCGTVKTPAGSEAVKAGECSYCAKGNSHSLCNTGNEDLEFFAVVPVQ